MARWNGAAVDMPISDVQGNGGNSLRVFNSDGTDVVLEFGEAFSTGIILLLNGYVHSWRRLF